MHSALCTGPGFDKPPYGFGIGTLSEGILAARICLEDLVLLQAVFWDVLWKLLWKFAPASICTMALPKTIHPAAEKLLLPLHMDRHGLPNKRWLTPLLLCAQAMFWQYLAFLNSHPD